MYSTLWLIVLAGALSIVYGIVTTRSLMAADVAQQNSCFLQWLGTTAA